MPSDFTLNYPPTIIFGAGSAARLPSLLPYGVKSLVVTGGAGQGKPWLEKLMALFPADKTLFASGLGAEAPLPGVDRLIGLGRDGKVGAVVAVGGGSVIDAAKAAAAIIPCSGMVTEYFEGRSKISSKGLFFAAAPTTAGSGAEITCNAVLISPESGKKQSIRHPLMVPDVAVVDPELTLSVPPETTASSGMDALVQAVESYTSSSWNPASRALAETAVGIILGSLLRAWKDGTDLEARTAMAQGSLLSAMAFSQSGLGAVHGLAHPIGSLLKIPHGLVCSILMSHIFEWNMPVCSGEYGVLAAKCGFRSPHELLRAIESLRDGVAIPSSLHGFGLAEKHFDFIVKNCRSRSMQTNPRPMSDAEVRELLYRLT